MSSMELCALLGETDARTFNPAISKGLKALTEYQYLVEEAAAAARAFLAGELLKFDPTVGDNACHIRTIKTLLLTQDARVVAEMTGFERLAMQVQEACTNTLTSQALKKKGGQTKTQKPTESCPQEAPNLSLRMTADVAYFVQAYIIKRTQETLTSRQEILDFCLLEKPSPTRMRTLSNERITRGCADRIIAFARQYLSHASLVFIQAQAQLTANPIYIAACQEPFVGSCHKVDVMLHSVPLFYSCRVLIKTCLRERIPIVFKIKLYAQDLAGVHIGTEYVALKFAGNYEGAAAESALFTFSDRISVRREDPDGVAGDEGIAPAIAEEPDASDGCLAADRKLTEKVNKAAKPLRSFVCVFEGMQKDTLGNLQTFKQKRREILSNQGACVIYAGAADHPQYMQGCEAAENLEKLAALMPEGLSLSSYKKIAHLLGCGESNKSLFFIQHVYPQSRHCLEEEESAEPAKQNEGKYDV